MPQPTTLAKAQTGEFEAMRTVGDFEEGAFFYWAYRATTVISDSDYAALVASYNTWQDKADAGLLHGTKEDGSDFVFSAQSPVPDRPRPIIHRP